MNSKPGWKETNIHESALPKHVSRQGLDLHIHHDKSRNRDFFCNIPQETQQTLSLRQIVALQVYTLIRQGQNRMSIIWMAWDSAVEVAQGQIIPWNRILDTKAGVGVQEQHWHCRMEQKNWPLRRWGRRVRGRVVGASIWSIGDLLRVMFWA